MAYVASIQDSKIRVLECDKDLEDALSDLRTLRTRNGELVIRFSKRGDLPDILTRLRDRGVAFAGAPHGWPPAEVFAELRDKGLASGVFDEVVFLGEGKREQRRR